MFNSFGGGNGLAPGDPRRDEAYAHYQEGVRLGHIKKNPMDMGQETYGLAPGDPRRDEAYAHYQEGVRLGYIKKNPMDMSPAQQQQNQQNSEAPQFSGREMADRIRKAAAEQGVKDRASNNTEDLLNQYYQARQRSEDVINKATAGLSGSFYQAPTSFYQG